MPGSAIPLDADALALFEAKGPENAGRVRRVMQLTADVTNRTFSDLRILDLGCGEGVFAIEAAMRGATVVAVDGRTERMDDGRAIARRMGLERLTFVEEDVRRLDVGSYGQFDVVYVLGLLYHLDARDAFDLLATLRRVCRGFVIIDTHVSPDAEVSVRRAGRVYDGRWFFEHAARDDARTVRARVQASLDNPRSFWFTRPSLYRALRDAGFTTVLECHVPVAPHAGRDRTTFVAAAGAPVAVPSYPWASGLDDDATAGAIRERMGPANVRRGRPVRGLVAVARRSLRRARARLPRRPLDLD